jgi:methylmalonyl-CoA carboxyltransferase small subunit
LKLQIKIDGKTYEAEVEVLEEEEILPAPGYAPYQPAAATPPMPAPGGHAQIHAAGSDGEEAKLCRSPVTGLVIRVNVAPGQAVQANDLIVVLEAMKMETNVTAHRAGTVKSVRVAAGDSVKAHQIMVEFE